MKKIVFRFDIDTHKCIKQGVPALLELSNRVGVPFSFFLNVGRAVSFRDSVKDIFMKEAVNEEENIEMMSAMQKLGLYNYIYAALVNPSIISYKKQVKALLNSNCEVGIHGGRNHAVWEKYAAEWNEDKIKDEILFAIENIRKIKPDYSLSGFASPAWVHPQCLTGVLKELGFCYCADFHELGANPVVADENFKTLGVNLLGEPGGVAFFENCRKKNYSTEKIIHVVMKSIEKNDITVLYDHPYYAGTREINCITKIIELIQKQHNLEICTLRSLV